MRRLTRPRGRARRAAAPALLAGVALAAALAACASAGPPPGGPERKAPPKIVAVTPESGAVNTKPGAVQFRFDEVVSDRPSRAPELNQVFLISPRDGEPRVNWHRDHIDVRPRRGWRPNTAYTVTLLPGLVDMRGNEMKTGASIVFSTGPTLPRLGILGRVFDWTAQQPSRDAIVEAVSLPDSTVFVATTDSLGAFTIGPFGPGTYLVRAIIDQNHNFALDRNELWDSTTVTVAETRQTVELLAIKRDTMPPRLQTVAADDSLTIRLTFDQALDPLQPFSPENFSVKRADSTALRIARVVTPEEVKAEKEALQKARQDSMRVADSVKAARRDTTRRDTTGREIVAAPRELTGPRRVEPPPPPKPSRPAPPTALLLELARGDTLQPGSTYRVTARNVRNLLGRSATMSRTLVLPKKAPPDTTKRAPGDTTRRAPGDTTRRVPGDTAVRRPPADSARRPPPAATPARPPNGRP